MTVLLIFFLFQKLAKEYSDTLKLAVADVKDSLLLLQARSLSRLREQEQYRACGLCTLRVKISGIPSSDEATCSKKLAAGPQQLSVPVFLSDSGKVLLEKIASDSGIPAYRYRYLLLP